MPVKWVADHFQEIQYILIGLFVLAGFYTLKSKDEPTRFKVREADRKEPIQKKMRAEAASPKAKSPPLSLPGLVSMVNLTKS